jgi:hypothetical protein
MPYKNKAGIAPPVRSYPCTGRLAALELGTCHLGRAVLEGGREATGIDAGI